MQNNEPKYKIPLILVYNRTLPNVKKSSKLKLEHNKNNERI